MSEAQTNDSPGATTHVVVLIHGTWARGIRPFKLGEAAAWCRRESELCQTIDGAIKAPDKVVFDAFSWSGGNSAAARLDAAAQLKDHLAALREKYPGSPIRIVAHSHGGNVAMYCLRDKDACAQVCGLACLSTPFLLVRPRHMDKHLAMKLRFMLQALIVVSLVMVIVTVLAKVDVPEEIPLWNLISMSFLAGAILLALPRLGSMLDGVHRWNHRAGRALALPRSLPFPVLIVRNTADEASNALAGAQFMTWLTSIALRWSAAVLPDADEGLGSSHWIGRLFRWCTAAAGLGGVLAVASALDLPFGDSVWSAGPWLIGGAIGAFFGLTIGSMLVIPVMWVFVGVLGVAMAPFGPRMALGALSLHVSAEGCPPGTWQVLQLSSTPRQFGDGLQHATYASPLALNRLRDWMGSA